MVGTQAPRKYLAKVLSEEVRRIWSIVTWPSSLTDVIQRSCEMAKVKKKLTINAFHSTQSILPPIPSPRIGPIDEGSLLRKTDDIPEDPLIPSPPEFIITEDIQQVISYLNKQHQDKGKKHVSEP